MNRDLAPSEVRGDPSGGGVQAPGGGGTGWGRNRRFAPQGGALLGFHDFLFSYLFKLTFLCHDTVDSLAVVRNPRERPLAPSSPGPPGETAQPQDRVAAVGPEHRPDRQLGWDLLGCVRAASGAALSPGWVPTAPHFPGLPRSSATTPTSLPLQSTPTPPTLGEPLTHSGSLRPCRCDDVI